MLAHQWRLLRSDAPIFEMSEEKKTYRKQYMECHHRYLSSYTAPTLDTTCNKKREQLLFHDLSTLPLNFFSTKWVAISKESKAEGKWRRHSNWKKETRGTNLDISRLQANLAVLSMQGERKQKTKTNELSENDGRGIAGCLDLSNTAKIQAGVAGHQFQPECYCYSGRTASCYWVWTWNRTGAVRSQPKSGHQQQYDIGIWIHEPKNSPQNECHYQCHAATCYDDFGWPNCRELKLWHAFCVFDGSTKGCLIKQAMEHLLGIGAALLRQHRLNATCSNRLLKPLKPHAHILMYKSAAASVSTHEKQLQVQKNPANNFVFCLPGYSCSDLKILTPFTYPVPCRHWSWKMHEPVPNNFQKSLTPRNWIWMVMDMGLLAVSIYQTRPKSKQELQVTSFNPNATATAVEQPAATEFGPGIAQERCVHSPNRGTNNNMWYRDLDPWTQKFTSEWMSLSMPRCYMLWWLWLTKLQGTEVVACLLCIWWVN